jgi:penicillin-binding protein 1C
MTSFIMDQDLSVILYNFIIVIQHPKQNYRMDFRKILNAAVNNKPVRFTFFIVISLLFIFILLDNIFPLRTNVEYSTIVTSKDSTLFHAFLTSDDKWRMYTELHEITPQLEKAIIFKEDRFFRYHFGINPLSVARALLNNTIRGKRTSGASTITMQVARLLMPKKRTYWNKFKEMLRAVQLEWHLSKDEILQLYLNLVPYGSNIEGVKSASVIYFDKAPNHLSIAEIAALSIIPNRPVSLRPGDNNDYIIRERNKWLKRYLKSGLFSEESINDALGEPLDAYRREVPKIAPHIAYRLKSEYPYKKIIRTNIDLEMQQKLQEIVRDYSRRLYFQNIKNATVLLVENNSRKVLSYIGSADYYDDNDGGQVDGIKAVRSPGSTLKPLLYGLAFDMGFVTPKSVISDVPVSFGGYEPENYDGKFYGNVTVEHALCNSLNVPAVKTLDKIGTTAFFDKLVTAGFKQIEKDHGDMGLSSILGGCGTTLEELTGLFTAFANNGIYKNLSYSYEGNITYTESEILSKSSAYMITEILTQLARPDLPVEWQNTSHMPKIAWKTGTSYGRRDAWSIGYNKKYTVGVWVGNFSGEGVPELNGADKAAPLLFKIFNAVDYDSEEDWYHMPDELSFRYVCSESGKVPADFCENQVIDYFIPGISGTDVCDHLKPVFINPDSTISYCTSCRPDAGYIKAYYQNYRPEIITYMNENNISYLKIPPHNPDCERLMAGLAPVITSPVHENEYFADIRDSMQIMLSCNASNDVSRVYWYINNKFFKSVLPNEKIFFEPPEGNVKISCSDDKGRNRDIFITVKYIEF